MRLSVDVRANPWPPLDDDRTLTLSDIDGLMRAPRELLRVLRGERWDTVRVVRDTIPLSGVQAGAVGLASLARTTRFEVASPSGERSYAAAGFFGRACWQFAVALTRELFGTAVLLGRAARVARRPVTLRAASARPQAITYIRAEHILRYHGMHVGGAATHTAGVINGFADMGLEIEVYAPERPGGTDAVRCHEVPHTRVYHLVPWLTLTAYGRKLAAAARRCRADAIYQRYALGSYVGLDLAQRLDVPLILEFNGSEIWASEHWGPAGVRLAERALELELRNIQDASLVVVVSDVLRDQLVEHGVAADRILVNPERR